MANPNPNDPRAAVEQAIASAGPNPQLIGLEAVEIQRFVTASSRPIAIEGASEAITDFDKKNQDRPGVIFAGGGRGVLVVPRARSAELMKEIECDYHERTCGAPLAIVDVPFDPNQQAESLRWLWLKLSAARDACEMEPMEMGFSQGVCADCNARPAERPSPRPDQPEQRICGRCYKLIKTAQQNSRRDNEERPSLSDLSASTQIAAVSADGNCMGVFFRSLDSLVAHKVGSETVSSIFRQAHVNALKKADSPSNVAPITGGDDIRVFLPPKAVLDYVTTLVESVHSQVSELQLPAGLLSARSIGLLKNLGVGLGFVVADDHYPARRLQTLAHKLEKDSKRCCLEQGSSAIAFAILTSEDQGDSNRLQNECLVPFKKWTNFVNQARLLSEVPGTQRAQVSQAWQMNREEFFNLFRYQLARTRAWREWYEAQGINWADPQQVQKHPPDRASLALAQLIKETTPS